MAVVTLPADLLALIGRQSFGSRNFDLGFASDLTGASQTRLLAPPRWTCGLVGLDDMLPAQAAVWRAFIMSLRGQVNQLAVYDLLAAAARVGTYVGAPTLSSQVAIGATSMTLTDATQAARTWKKGEYVGLGQSGATRQLFVVQADATANGAGQITLTVEPPSRYLVASGQPVAWDKPTCLMRRTTADASWDVDGYMSGGFSLDLAESWES